MPDTTYEVATRSNHNAKWETFAPTHDLAYAESLFAQCTARKENMYVRLRELPSKTILKATYKGADSMAKLTRVVEDVDKEHATAFEVEARRSDKLPWFIAASAPTFNAAQRLSHRYVTTHAQIRIVQRNPDGEVVRVTWLQR
jgi:hypothetical protein